MTEEESYLFDLRGFIVVKNALQQDQIDDLSQRLEAHRSSNLSPILIGSNVLGDDRDAWSAPSLLELGGVYLDLIDLPTIVPYLTKLLGEQYRLDHDYAKIDSKMPERKKHYIYMAAARAQAAQQILWAQVTAASVSTATAMAASLTVWWLWRSSWTMCRQAMAASPVYQAVISRISVCPQRGATAKPKPTFLTLCSESLQPLATRSFSPKPVPMARCPGRANPETSAELYFTSIAPMPLPGVHATTTPTTIQI